MTPFKLYLFYSSYETTTYLTCIDHWLIGAVDYVCVVFVWPLSTIAIGLRTVYRLHFLKQAFVVLLINNNLKSCMHGQRINLMSALNLLGSLEWAKPRMFLVEWNVNADRTVMQSPVILQILISRQLPTRPVKKGWMQFLFSQTISAIE